MRLVTFEISTPAGRFQRVGALSEAGVVDLVASYGAKLAEDMVASRAGALAAATIGTTMVEFFEGEARSREAADEAVEFALAEGSESDRLGPSGERLIHGEDEVKLGAPVARPLSVRDYTGFRSHMEAFLKSADFPDLTSQIFRSRPMYYKANPNMVLGPDAVIPWPTIGEKVDFEIEPAIFIGKRGINVSPEDAEDYIAGYTIMNDISIRDYQKDEMELPVNLYGVSKSKDAGWYPIGPCVVTPDELSFENLDLIVRVNGEEWVRENTREMTWSFAEIISYSSLDEPLVPGECMAGGAPPRGCGADVGRWVQPGDVIECEIEGIGVLRNSLGERPEDRSVLEEWSKLAPA